MEGKTALLFLRPHPGYLSAEAAVLSRCLTRVAFVAQGLKVPLVVEKGSVSLVWNDVVDVCRHHDLPLLEALFTVRVLGDESITQLLPAVRVPARVRIARDLHALLLTPLGCLGLCLGVTPGACFLVAFTVAVATRHGAVTSWIGTQCKERHIIPIKTPA